MGTSGLIVAYREAARMAIEESEIIECHEKVSISFTFPYMSMNSVMKIAKRDDVEIKHQVFDNSCNMVVEMRKDLSDEIRGRLLSVDGVTLQDS